MKHALKPVIVGLLLQAIAPVRAEPPLGRLFLDPERRSALERLRQLDLVDEEQQVKADRYTVHGIVTRESGATTLWLNDRRLQAMHPEAIGIRAETPDRARLTPEPGRELDLRVGETLDAESGETTSGLRGGWVSRHAPR